MFHVLRNNDCKQQSEDLIHSKVYRASFAFLKKGASPGHYYDLVISTNKTLFQHQHEQLSTKKYIKK